MSKGKIIGLVIVGVIVLSVVSYFLLRKPKTSNQPGGNTNTDGVVSTSVPGGEEAPNLGR